MKLLIIYLACLFLSGCGNGGFVLQSTIKPQKVVDMDLLAMDDFNVDSVDDMEDVEEMESAPDMDVAPSSQEKEKEKEKEKDKEKPYKNKPEGSQALEAQKNRPHKPTQRRFGKRPKSQRVFGKKGSQSDLVVKEPVVEVSNKVDVLFVVDGSFSTRDVLRAMPERMDGFVPALDESLDWRAGFISAHVKRNEDKELSSMEMDGAIVLERKYITKGTRSKERILIDTLTRNSNQRRCAFPPQCGGFRETPLLALTEYILSPTRSVANGTRFIRDEAHLAVVIVTDNKENKKRRKRRVTAESVIDTVRQEFGDDKEFSVHALTTTNDICRGQLKKQHFFAEGKIATEILFLSRETGGANLSLCSYDYAVPLAEAIKKSVLGETDSDCTSCVETVTISDRKEQV